MRNRSLKRLRPVRWLLGIGAVVAWAPVAAAQVAECIPARDQNDPDGDGVTFEHITSFGRREIRVSTTNLDALGVSTTSVIRAVGLATSIWNEQSGGRPMRYAANTALTELPSSLSQCQQDGTTYSLVVVDPGSDPGGGTNTAKIGMRCIDPFSSTMRLAWAFKLTLYAKDLNGNTNAWVTAARTLSAGQLDLVSTLVHELGHAFNITHHSRVDAGLTETQFSVMGYGDSFTDGVICTGETFSARPLSRVPRRCTVARTRAASSAQRHSFYRAPSTRVGGRRPLASRSRVRTPPLTGRMPARASAAPSGGRAFHHRTSAACRTPTISTCLPKRSGASGVPRSAESSGPIRTSTWAPR